MKLIRLIWGGVIFTTALAGCQNEDIYLAEDINTVKYNQAFRDMFGEIDPNQDFNMATLLKANIQVNFGTGKEYTVKFYTDNPRVNKDDTYLLGKFTVKDGVAQEVQLDVPEYMQKIYVGCINEDKDRIIDEFEIKDGTAEVRFATAGGTGSRASTVTNTDNTVTVYYGGIENKDKDNRDSSKKFESNDVFHQTNTPWLDWNEFIIIKGYDGSETESFKALTNYYGTQTQYSNDHKQTEEMYKFYNYTAPTTYGYGLFNVWKFLTKGTAGEGSGTYNLANGTHGAPAEESGLKSCPLTDQVLTYFPEGKSIVGSTITNPNFELLAKSGTVNLFPVYAKKGFRDFVGFYHYKKESGKDIDKATAESNSLILFDTDPTAAEFHHIYQEFLYPQDIWNQETVEDLTKHDGWQDAYFNNLLDWKTGEDYRNSDFGNRLVYKRVRKMSIQVPVGERIGLWIDAEEGDGYSRRSRYENSGDYQYDYETSKLGDGYKRHYSNISLNDETTDSQGAKSRHSYIAVLNQTLEYNGKQYYIVGMEDHTIGQSYTSTYGGNPQTCDDDCNDIVLAIEATDVYPVDVDSDEKGMTWTLAYEDLGGIGDFDFNDVVIQLSHAAGETTATLHLMATGGTLPVWLGYINETAAESEKYVLIGTGDNKDIRYSSKEALIADVTNNPAYELHSMLANDQYKGQLLTTYPMYNTTKKHFEPRPLNSPTVPDNFTASLEVKQFFIIVKKSDGTFAEIQLPRSKGENTSMDEGDTRLKAPQGFCVATKWDWPTETTNILEVYPKFRRWVNGGNGTEGDISASSAIGWYSEITDKSKTVHIDPPTQQTATASDNGNS
ncbi:DUF4842 domain-containing protein [uncultured Bacteroides sp.]|uniref:DUF4842 domain-containing protein n=1 Tax=uncultured Bacteroides sp. TaxID=162156 RepID=UPI00262DE8CF|nr:DUF4842 domain-containing protein [uncultured Bacteroides sp.]